MRQDLPFGVICAQVAHAAGESSTGQMPPGTRVVILSVPNQAKLLALERILTEHNITHVAIREPDLPYFDEAMAIGLKPVEKSLVYNVLKKLPLLKGELK